MPFDAAWASAMRSIPRADADVPEWREILRWARERYRREYEASESRVAPPAAPDVALHV